MKRIFTAILAGIALLGTAIGSAAQGAKPYEVVVAYIVMGNVPSDNQAVQDAINKIAVPKVGASIKLVPLGTSAYSNQLNLVLATDEQWDIIVDGTIIGIGGHIARNQVIALDELLDKYGKGIKGVLDADMIDTGKIRNGKLYGIPPVKNFAGGFGYMMRKDLADKYKIDPAKIKSLDDVEAVLKLIKQKEPDLIPLVPPNVRASPFAPTVYNAYDTLGNNGGVLMNRGASLKVENWFESAEYRKLLERMHKWNEAGYTMKGAATNTDPISTIIKTGKAFSYLANTKAGFAAQETIKNGVEMVMADIMPGFACTDNCNGWLWSITRNSKNPQKAMEMLNLLYTDPAVSTLLIDGIEGKHYVKGADGLVDFPAGIDASNSPYYYNSPWLFPNQTITPVWTGFPPSYWKDLLAYNESAKKSKAIGFVFDPTPVKSQVTAISNVIEQYSLGLEYGDMDPAVKLPEYQAKLKRAGIDKVIAEKQRQLDEWAKAKGIR